MVSARSRKRLRAEIVVSMSSDSEIGRGGDEKLGFGMGLGGRRGGGEKGA